MASMEEESQQASKRERERERTDIEGSRRKNNGPLLNKRLTYLSFAYIMFRFFQPFFMPINDSVAFLVFVLSLLLFCIYALLFSLSAFHSLSFMNFFRFVCCCCCCCLYAWRLNRIMMWILLRLANNDAIHNRWGSLGMDVFRLYLGQLYSHLFYRIRTFRQTKNSCRTRTSCQEGEGKYTECVVKHLKMNQRILVHWNSKLIYFVS